MDLEDLGMTRRARRGARVDVQRTEACAERLVLVDVQFLAAKEQDLMVQQRRFDFGEFRLVQGGEVEAMDLGADHRGQRFNVHGAIIGTRRLRHVA